MANRIHNATETETVFEYGGHRVIITICSDRELIEITRAINREPMETIKIDASTLFDLAREWERKQEEANNPAPKAGLRDDYATKIKELDTFLKEQIAKLNEIRNKLLKEGGDDTQK